MGASYAEIVDWASEMNRGRAVLQLARLEFPAPSTLWRSFERMPTRIWRQLFDRSATTWDPGDHGALDATFFDRQAASSHYRDRSDRHIETLKTTALVDTESCAVLDLHCAAHWPPDTQDGRRVALRNTDELGSLAGDKGYDDQSLRDTLRKEGIRPLIKPTACVSTIQTGQYPTRHGILHHGPSVTQTELEHISSTESLQETLQRTHTTIGADILAMLVYARIRPLLSAAVPNLPDRKHRLV